MPRGLGFVIVGILAVIGGAAFIGLLLRNKLRRSDDDADFDEFDGDIDDIEFEEYFSGDGDVTEDVADIAEASEASISTDEGDSDPAETDDSDMQTSASAAEIGKQAETEDNGPAASTEPEEVK
jgi:hypothetical protein